MIRKIIFGAAILCSGCQPGTDASMCDDPDVAIAATKAYMLDLLVSPGTAVFSEFKTSDNTLLRVGYCIFQMRGYVDSQNRMGGVLRTNMTIRAEFNLNTHQWDVVNSAGLIEAIRALESQEN